MRLDIENEETRVYLTDDYRNTDCVFKTSDVIDSIVDQFKPLAKTGIFMPRLVWMSDDHSSLIYERPPFVAEIQYHHGVKGQAQSIGVTTFSIPIPWTVWGIHFDDGHFQVPNPTNIFLFARNKPIAATTDMLYWLPIPNMDPACRCCTGEGFLNAFQQPFLDKLQLAEKAGINLEITLAEMVNHILNLFWFGIFNQDYNWTENYRLPAETPEEIHEHDVSAVRAVKFLNWWSQQDLATSVMNHYTQSNAFGKGGDTVQQLIDWLTEANERRKAKSSLRFMHRIVTNVAHKHNSNLPAVT